MEDYPPAYGNTIEHNRDLNIFSLSEVEQKKYSMPMSFLMRKK